MKEQGETQRKRGFMLAFLAGLLWGLQALWLSISLSKKTLCRSGWFPTGFCVRESCCLFMQ